MRGLLSRNLFVVGLAGLAITQVGLLATKGESSSSWYEVGEVLPAELASDGEGETVAGDGYQPTVMLVFNSQCSHCENVAPLWGRTTRALALGVRVLAVSSGPPESEVAYAGAHGWNAEVRTVDSHRTGGPEHRLTSRTPWVFVLDSADRILAEGHGSKIEELVAVLEPDFHEASEQ